VRRANDTGMALLSVILLIMICAAMSVLMLGAIVSQVKPTMFAQKNARTIGAAEAGIEASLSQIRTANGAADVITGAIYGDPRLLPCSVQGKVNGTTGTLAYTVTISYFDEAPANRDDTWRAANKLVCTPGHGLSAPPSSALLSSVGSDVAVAGYAANAGNRTLESIYTFKVMNNSVDGGTIYSFGDAYCLEATGQAPGSKIVYALAAACRDDDPRRMWSYGVDYAIHLAVTDLAGSTKLCIASTPAGGEVTLEVCNNTAAQKFSWRGGAEWVGQVADNSNYSSLCLGTADSATAVLTGLKLKYASSNCTGGNSAYKSFDPDPRVGAGPAGKATNQIVNFLEFGRCFDVTGESVTATYMIAYPCKQDPSTAKTNMKWNHRWYYTEPTTLEGIYPGTIRVSTGASLTSGTVYCLRSPVSPSIYPVLVSCNGSAEQSWKRTAKAGTYADSWTFTDNQGKCISLGDKFDGWSKLTVALCNGLPEQKWNAPADAQSASLDSYKELN